MSYGVKMKDIESLLRIVDDAHVDNIITSLQAEEIKHTHLRIQTAGILLQELAHLNMVH
jgi:hypothetical protein